MMLTQFGKTWINTSLIFSVTEGKEETPGGISSERMIIRSGATTTKIFSEFDDPEGFKAFKEWLEQQRRKPLTVAGAFFDELPSYKKGHPSE